jgi:hypothetical protein
LADVQQAVKRCLPQAGKGIGFIQGVWVSDEEPKEADPEEHRIRRLKARSLFASIMKGKADLFGEDRF